MIVALDALGIAGHTFTSHRSSNISIRKRPHRWINRNDKSYINMRIPGHI